MTAARSNASDIPERYAFLACLASAAASGPLRVLDALTAADTLRDATSRVAEESEFSDGGSCEEYRDATMLPSTATPSAPPSSRVVSFMAEPTPAMRCATLELKPTIDRTAPNGSSFPCTGSRVFGKIMYPAINANAMTGMLIKKTDPHQKCSLTGIH